jgi:hypothetical protein
MSCQSSKPSQFNGEIAIHFPGVEGLNKITVWVFPKLQICLSCGFAAFTVPERELRALQQGSAIQDAVVWIEKGETNSEKAS